MRKLESRGGGALRSPSDSEHEITLEEPPPANLYDLVNALLAWTDGELEQDEVVELFQHLVDSGLAWQLEGHVGRCAQRLIDEGCITPPIPKPQAWTPGCNVGPYVHTDYCAVLSFPDQPVFRLLTYRAYNACGLIGYECNGVVVLDETNHRVVCDEVARVNSGYFGITAYQTAEFERLKSLSFDEFRQFINSHPRSRHNI